MNLLALQLGSVLVHLLVRRLVLWLAMALVLWLAMESVQMWVIELDVLEMPKVMLLVTELVRRLEMVLA